MFVSISPSIAFFPSWSTKLHEKTESNYPGNWSSTVILTVSFNWNHIFGEMFHRLLLPAYYCNLTQNASERMVPAWPLEEILIERISIVIWDLFLNCNFNWYLHVSIFVTCFEISPNVSVRTRPGNMCWLPKLNFSGSVIHLSYLIVYTVYQNPKSPDSSL